MNNKIEKSLQIMNNHDKSSPAKKGAMINYYESITEISSEYQYKICHAHRSWGYSKREFVIKKKSLVEQASQTIEANPNETKELYYFFNPVNFYNKTL